MAIRRYAGDRFSGLSTDSKPSNVEAGALFTEIDNNVNFIYDGTEWKKQDYLRKVEINNVVIHGEPNNGDVLAYDSALQGFVWKSIRHLEGLDGGYASWVKDGGDAYSENEIIFDGGYSTI